MEEQDYSTIGKCWIFHKSGTNSGPFESGVEAAKRLKPGDEIRPYFDNPLSPEEQARQFQEQLQKSQSLPNLS